jgi:hypothetical protein
MMISWWQFADCLGCRWVIERGWELVSREVYHSQGEFRVISHSLLSMLCSLSYRPSSVVAA